MGNIIQTNESEKICYITSSVVEWVRVKRNSVNSSVVEWVRVIGNLITSEVKAPKNRRFLLPQEYCNMFQRTLPQADFLIIFSLFLDKYF